MSYLRAYEQTQGRDYPCSCSQVILCAIRLSRLSFEYVYHTFGHRYLDISFVMAQSAFLCSLFETVCSDSRPSGFGASFGFALFGSSYDSGLIFSDCPKRCCSVRTGVSCSCFGLSFCRRWYVYEICRSEWS